MKEWFIFAHRDSSSTSVRPLTVSPWWADTGGELVKGKFLLSRGQEAETGRDWGPDRILKSHQLRLLGPMSYSGLPQNSATSWGLCPPWELWGPFISKLSLLLMGLGTSLGSLRMGLLWGTTIPSLICVFKPTVSLRSAFHPYISEISTKVTKSSLTDSCAHRILATAI